MAFILLFVIFAGGVLTGFFLGRQTRKSPVEITNIKYHFAQPQRRIFL